MNYVTQSKTPLGTITMASDGKALTGLWFNDGKYFGETLDNDTLEKDLPIFEDTRRWLDIYFTGKNPDFTPKIKLSGSDFRLSVWKILKEIPYGRTVTYGQIAAKIAKQRGLEQMSAQAVGGAVGHNPISIIIPCHRVIGTDGSLTGYAGGLKRKTKLLELENSSLE